MGFLENLGINNKIRKLKKAKNDLSNDYNAIQNYNGYIDSVISDFQDFVKKENTGVVSKLENYKEPYQYNDGNLTSACNYIQYEINYQNKQLSDDKD